MLTAELIAQLAAARTISLKSYSSFDLHGAVNLGDVDSAGHPAIESLVIDAPAIGGYGAGDRIIRAGSITLVSSTSGVAQPYARAPDGTGSLTFEAGTLAAGGGGVIVRGEGDKSVQGFDVTRLAASDRVAGRGTGSLAVTGDLAVTTGVLTEETGAHQSLISTGVLNVARSGDGAAPSAGVGARLLLSGARVIDSGVIALTAGALTLAATGSGTADDVVLSEGALVDVSGARKNYGSSVAYAPGGFVELSSSAGSVRVLSGATVDVSGAGDGGDAGALKVAAANGALILAGNADGHAAAGYRGGTIAVDVGALPEFSTLNTSLNAGGFAEERSLRVRGGNVVIASTDTVAARRFSPPMELPIDKIRIHRQT